MNFVEKHLDDRFYLEDVQRIDVRKKIAREVCVNLLIHREFSNPYPAKMIIEKEFLKTENANKAKMIGNIDVDFYEPYPKNPKIAKVFKEIGLADELGSGVKNIYKYTKIYSGGVPEIIEDDIFRVRIPIMEKSEQDSDQGVTKVSDQEKILSFCIEERKMSEIMQMMNLTHRNNFKKRYIEPLLETNKLKMTIPNKPNSMHQKYITVDKL